MSSRTVITLHCDWCDTTELVETYTITVNGQKYEFEACDRHYQENVLVPFAVVARTGRRINPGKGQAVEAEAKYSRRTKAAHMPGTDWRFTHHAMVRMGERAIQPTDVIEMVNDPEMTMTSRDDESLFVYTKGGLQATVDPARKVIVTAANRISEAVTA